MRRTPEQRRADRAAGVDRFGRPLPRTLGTNPRAQRAPDGAARRRGWRIPKEQLAEFARQERIVCFKCKSPGKELAAGGWREASKKSPDPSWVICTDCIRKGRQAA